MFLRGVQQYCCSTFPIAWSRAGHGGTALQSPGHRVTGGARRHRPTITWSPAGTEAPPYNHLVTWSPGHLVTLSPCKTICHTRMRTTLAVVLWEHITLCNKELASISTLG